MEQMLQNHRLYLLITPDSIALMQHRLGKVFRSKASLRDFHRDYLLVFMYNQDIAIQAILKDGETRYKYSDVKDAFAGLFQGYIIHCIEHHFHLFSFMTDKSAVFAMHSDFT